METTYNQIINQIETFVKNHYQINRFVNDHPLAVNKSEGVDFPVVALYPAESSINRSLMTLNIKAFFMDILDNDKSNEREVLSDQLQIGNDFIQYFARNEDNWGFYIDETTVTMEPFSENFESLEDTNIEDNVAGWYFDLNIIVDNVMNNCNIPIINNKNIDNDVDSGDGDGGNITELSFNLLAGGTTMDEGKDKGDEPQYAGYIQGGYGSITPDYSEVKVINDDGEKISLMIINNDGNARTDIISIIIDGVMFDDLIYNDESKTVDSILAGGTFQPGDKYDIIIRYPNDNDVDNENEDEPKKS